MARNYSGMKDLKSNPNLKRYYTNNIRTSYDDTMLNSVWSQAKLNTRSWTMFTFFKLTYPTINIYIYIYIYKLLNKWGGSTPWSIH